MLQIRKNPLYIELISYNLFDSDIEKKSDTIRDYDTESSKRSKARIIEFAINNEWNYFITITINKKLHDRTNYELISKKLRKFLNNYKKRYDHEFKYLLIYEPHKKTEENGKKAIHFHGLFKINNLDYWQLNFVKQKEMAFIYTSGVVKKTFGRNDFTKIYNNAEFLSYYISKYITKNIKKQMLLNMRYFKSNDLNEYEKKELSGKAESKFYELGISPSYENKFVKKYRFTFEEFEVISKSFIKEIGDII